jgi:hypothetical protein
MDRKKGTKAKRLRIRDDRFDFINTCLATQMPSGQIVKAVSHKYKITERTAWGNLSEEIRRYEAENVKERPVQKHRMRHSLRVLYQECLKQKNYRTAIQVLDRLCRIDGLFAPEEVEVSGGLTHEHEHEHKHIHATTGDLRAELQQLMVVRQKMLTAGRNGKSGKANGSNGKSVH